MRTLKHALVTSLFASISIAICTSTCHAKAPAPATSPTATAAAAPSTQPTAGARFKRFAIKDDQGFKEMEVFRGVMPADWNIKGGVIWKQNLATPQLFRIHWGDAQDVRAVDLYPSVAFTWSQAAQNGQIRVQRGGVFAGFIVEPTPKDQWEAFNVAILQLFRKDLANVKVVNREKLPDVARKFYDQINTDPNTAFEVAAGRETFEYEINGQTVDEMVTGVFAGSMARVGNPTGIVNWKVVYGCSRRAPKGELEQIRPIESVMAQSLQINPDWLKRVNDYNQQNYQKAVAAQQQYNANQQAWFNATEQRIASQSAANDAQHASYWAHSADLDRQSENSADVMREVSPWKSDDGSVFKLPTAYSYAWQGTDGQIIMNNNAGYNPNSDPSQPTGTTWTPMEQTKN